MVRRIVVGAALVLAGCGGGGDDPVAEVVDRPGDDRATTVVDRPGDAGATEATIPEVDETPIDDVPTLDPDVELALGPEVVRPGVDAVVARRERPWIARPGVGGWSVVEVDAETGEDLRRVELGVQAAFPELALVDGDVLHLPASEAAGGVGFQVQRIDLATATATAVPMPAYVDELHVGAGSVWAAMDVGDSVELRDLGDPDAAPTVLPLPADELGHTLFVVADGVYDCFGDQSWGFTPTGTDERVTFELPVFTCHGTDAAAGLVVAEADTALVLAEGEVVRTATLPVDAARCLGPDQPDAPDPIVVCELGQGPEGTGPAGAGPGNGVAVLRLGSGEEATLIGEVGVEPRRSLAVAGVPHRWTEDGPVAFVYQGDITGPTASYLVGVSPDGTTVARTSEDDSAAAFEGGRVWVAGGPGEVVGYRP